MCIQDLDIIYTKQKHYKFLLKLCQKKLFDHEIEKIKRQSSSFLMIDMPNHEFKEIKNFYTSDFLKEFQQISPLGILAADLCENNE